MELLFVMQRTGIYTNFLYTNLLYTFASWSGAEACSACSAKDLFTNIVAGGLSSTTNPLPAIEYLLLVFKGMKAGYRGLPYRCM